MPVSARLSGNCEYGSVMQAIWNFVGDFCREAAAIDAGTVTPDLGATEFTTEDCTAAVLAGLD